MQIRVYDSAEYRIAVFEADTGLPLKSNPAAVADAQSSCGRSMVGSLSTPWSRTGPSLRPSLRQAALDYRGT